jgi:hypothetical protein
MHGRIPQEISSLNNLKASNWKSERKGTGKKNSSSFIAAQINFKIDHRNLGEKSGTAATYVRNHSKEEKNSHVKLKSIQI